MYKFYNKNITYLIEPFGVSYIIKEKFKMKKGFTLAEVLITLVIIGVIAAMTIPTLMNSTNQQEFRVGLKKAVSAINQAMSLNYALEGKSIGDSELTSSAEVVSNLFKKRMSVITTQTSNAAFATSSDVTPGSDNVFYTADGMRFALGAIGTGTLDTETNENYYGYMIIDVNGEKGPNTLTTDSAAPRDTYVATVYGNRIVAGKAGDNTGASKATREVMFDKK